MVQNEATEAGNSNDIFNIHSETTEALGCQHLYRLNQLASSNCFQP
jgi:hypothetical protein